MTTTETVTYEQIKSLRNEAASAGDVEQVRLCDQATAPMGRLVQGAALVACVKAINAAEAMA